MDSEKQDYLDELTRQLNGMKAEFDWLKKNQPFSEETAEMYYILYRDYQEKAFRDPEDTHTSSPIQEEVARQAEKIFFSINSNTVINPNDMETIDQLAKRQQQEYANLLEGQRDTWAILQKRHGQDMPTDIVNAFTKQGSEDIKRLAAKHLHERDNNVHYADIIGMQRQMEFAPQAAEQDLKEMVVKKDRVQENQQKLDNVQDEMERLLKQAREREANRTRSQTI